MSTNDSSPFSFLIGNPQVKRMLERLIARKQVPNTLLFHGPDGVGKTTCALALAKALMGKEHEAKIDKRVHPDLHFLEPEGKMGMHTIDALRTFIQQMALPPYEAPVKVFFVKDAHRMLPTGANAVLKTLEEPPSDTYIILTTDEPDFLLPTITSRCRQIPFFPIPEIEIGNYLSKTVPDTAWNKIAKRSQGSLGRALELAKGEDPSPQELLAILKSGFSYPVVAKGLEKLDAELSDEELPVEKKNQIVDSWLEHIAWWYRDCALVRAGESDKLFFQEEEVALKSQVKDISLPLSALIEKLAECRKAIQRNIKPSVALEAFFLFAENV
jgi:DNA polymerase-3 subunit delta'